MKNYSTTKISIVNIETTEQELIKSIELTVKNHQFRKNYNHNAYRLW